MKNINIMKHAIFIALAFFGLNCSNQKTGNTANTDGNNTITNKNMSALDAAPDSEGVSQPDVKFLNKAAEINLKEIKIGQLAQQNGSMTEVKQMGKMLEDDHTKSWNELVGLAKKKNINLPTILDKDAQSDYDKLSGKVGNDFDKTFSDMMVSGHKDAIDLFQNEIKSTNDPDIKRWTESTLPVLQKHLDHAKACQRKA